MKKQEEDDDDTELIKNKSAKDATRRRMGRYSC